MGDVNRTFSAPGARSRTLGTFTGTGPIRHHLALRQISMAHNARAAIFGLVIGMGGKQSSQFRFHGLLDQTPRA